MFFTNDIYGYVKWEWAQGERLGPMMLMVWWVCAALIFFPLIALLLKIMGWSLYNWAQAPLATSIILVLGSLVAFLALHWSLWMGDSLGKWLWKSMVSSLKNFVVGPVNRQLANLCLTATGFPKK